MTAFEEENDEGLTEDKPFSPMYPIFNFGAPGTAPPMQASDPPPSYGFAEKRGF